MKIKIATIQLFSGKHDIRKHLSIDISEEQKEELEDEYGLSYGELDELLEKAKIYVEMNNLPELIEVETEE